MYKEDFCRVKLLKETFFVIADRNTLFNKINNFDSNILNQTDATITKTLLCDNMNHFNEMYLQILNASIKFTLTSKKSDKLLLKPLSKSISVFSSVSLIKSISQFEHKLCFFHVYYHFYFYFRLF